MTDGAGHHEEVPGEVCVTAVGCEEENSARVGEAARQYPCKAISGTRCQTCGARSVPAIPYQIQHD
jgi:hypothetical protein